MYLTSVCSLVSKNKKNIERNIIGGFSLLYRRFILVGFEEYGCSNVFQTNQQLVYMFIL